MAIVTTVRGMTDSLLLLLLLQILFGLDVVSSQEGRNEGLMSNADRG
jgi:hypothetical protein